MSHVEAHPFPEGTGDCVSRVNPTVGVEDVLGNVFGMDAVNGVANILPSRDNQAECQQADNGESVVEPEYGRVDVHVADFDQGLEASEYVDHPSTGRIFFKLAGCLCCGHFSIFVAVRLGVQRRQWD